MLEDSSSESEPELFEDVLGQKFMAWAMGQDKQWIPASWVASYSSQFRAKYRFSIIRARWSIISFQCRAITIIIGIPTTQRHWCPELDIHDFSEILLLYFFWVWNIPPMAIKQSHNSVGMRLNSVGGFLSLKGSLISLIWLMVTNILMKLHCCMYARTKQLTMWCEQIITDTLAMWSPYQCCEHAISKRIFGPELVTACW